MGDIPHTDNVTVAMIAAALSLLEEAYKHVGMGYWSGSNEERLEQVLKDFREAYKAVQDTARPPRAKSV